MNTFILHSSPRRPRRFCTNMKARGKKQLTEFRVRALARDWAITLLLNKWALALRLTSIPSRGSRNTLSLPMLLKPEISADLMSHLTRMQIIVCCFLGLKLEMIVSSAINPYFPFYHNLTSLWKDVRHLSF